MPTCRVLVSLLLATACGGGPLPKLVHPDAAPPDAAPPDAPSPPDANVPADAPPPDAPPPDAAPPDAPPPKPDAQTLCPDPLPGACQYFLSCGCAVDAGEKCTAGSTGPFCIVAGAKKAWESCADETECESGTTCRYYGGAYRCLQYCDDAHGCPAIFSVDGSGEGDEIVSYQACYIRMSDTSTPPVVIAQACGPVCSLLEQDCPYSGQGCIPSSTYVMEAEHGLCVTMGTGGQGAPCSGSSACAPGSLCMPSDAGMICSRFCARDAAEPACDEGTTCKALTGHTNTGACLP